MARRRKKRFGAVTGRKAGAWGRQVTFNVSVAVMRGNNKYVATACPRKGHQARVPVVPTGTKGTKRWLLSRCGEGKGRTVTSASAAALRSMANKLR